MLKNVKKKGKTSVATSKTEKNDILTDFREKPKNDLFKPKNAQKALKITFQNFFRKFFLELAFISEICRNCEKEWINLCCHLSNRKIRYSDEFKNFDNIRPF